MISLAPMRKQKISRPIRSFIHRQRAITFAKQTILSELWPLYGVELHPEMLDFKKLFQSFPSSAPLTIEIGFGMGESLFAEAQAHPQEMFIGIEVHHPGVVNLLCKLKEHPLDNIKIIEADAVEILTNAIPDRSIDRISIFFPDPWPKRRHHKRRLIQLPFVEIITNKLKCGGSVHFATDWEDYAKHALAVFEKTSKLKNLAGKNQFHPRPTCRLLTRFEQRGIRLGHKTWDLVFIRGTDPDRSPQFFDKI